MEPKNNKGQMDKAAQESAAYRGLAENGPALLYILLIQALATQTYLWFAMRKTKKSTMAKLQRNDMAFLFWYISFNAMYSGLLAYAMWRRFMPRAPMRCFFGMVTAIPGVCASIFVEYVCQVGDKEGTRLSVNSPEGFQRRIWMHALIGMVISIAILFLIM